MSVPLPGRTGVLCRPHRNETPTLRH
jgi:hypothetical protein